jgi:hypothetical protein
MSIYNIDDIGKKQDDEPEIIEIITDENEGHFRREETRKQESLPQFKGPLFLFRFLAILLLCICLLWAAVTGALTILSTFVTLITLSHNDTAARKQIARRYRSFRHSLVMALSSAVAVFSPSFGMMIAMTYFLSQGQEMPNEELMSKFFHMGK